MDQPGTWGVAARLLKCPGSQNEMPSSSAYAASDKNPKVAIATPIAGPISRPPNFGSDMQRVICLPLYPEITVYQPAIECLARRWRPAKSLVACCSEVTQTRRYDRVCRSTHP